MEHWFDRATKFLAGGVSRREALKTGAMTGAAFLLPKGAWFESFFDETQRGQQRRRQDVAAEGPCTLSTVRGEHTATVTAATQHKGQSLTLHSVRKSVGGRFGSGTLVQRVEHGGSLLYERRFRFVPGYERASRGKKVRTAVVLGWARIRYGPAGGGPREVLLKVTGNKVQGFADGRPISSERRSQALVKVDPELQTSMKALVAAAQQNMSVCRSGGPRASPTRSELLHLRPASYAIAPNRASAEGDGSPEMLQSDACTQCHNHCDIQATACGITDLGEALADPLSLLGLAGCIYSYWSCENDCSQEGGVCCSVQCGEDICCASGQFCCQGQGTPLSCCDNGSVCVNGLFDGFYEYSYCCPGGSDPKGCQAGDSGGDIALYCRQPNQTCCGVFWACGSGQYCADVTYGICCPNGQPFCAGSCCDGTCVTYNPGTSAEFQSCCPPGKACGSGCCASGQNCLTAPSGAKVCCAQPLCGNECCTGGAICSNGKCGFGAPCGNTFCGFGTVCCNGTCCATCCNNQCCPGTNDTCIRGQCCPKQNSCGSVCCPSGQFCSGGRCVTGCPDGEDLSQAPDGTLTCCPLYQCDNPSNDNVCVEASCPKGVCCGQNQVCCPTESPGIYACMNPPCPVLAQ